MLPTAFYVSGCKTSTHLYMYRLLVKSSSFEVYLGVQAVG